MDVTQAYYGEFREYLLNLSIPQLNALWHMERRRMTTDQRRLVRLEARRRLAHMTDDEIDAADGTLLDEIQ